MQSEAMSTPTEEERYHAADLEYAVGSEVNLESTEITLKTTDQYGARDKHPKEPIVRMNLKLFRRRKTMLIAHYSDRLNHTSLEQMAEEFGCTVKALLNDLAKREIWEPFIWEAQQAHEDGKKQLNLLQLAREEALYMMKTCKNPNARVGAIGKFIESIKAEVEIKQSLGQLPKQIQPAVLINQNVLQQTNTDIESTVNLLADYEDVISEAAREELESLRQNSPEESVHKTGADFKTSEVPVA
jgi:hypothetical protein